MKEMKYDKQHTKKAKELWLKKLKLNTGQSIDGNDFFIPREVLVEALGPYWIQVFDKAIELGATNILAITSKSTRKTAIVKFIQHYLLAHNNWLQAKDLRRTKELSSAVLMNSHEDALRFWAAEYNLPWIRDVITRGAGKMYFVRDKKRKDNQEIEFSSFDGIAKEGGFTKALITHWEELVDPNSKGSAPTKDEFLYTYDLINSKNEENFLSRGQKYNQFPTNYFTMNRWDKDHPLIRYAELHAPWQPVKEWMLEDPLNNNFYMQYVEKSEEGWEDLDKTLIIYASKLSNHILIKNEEWKQKQLDLIETGDQQKLGIVLGDVFDGIDKNDNTYTWNEFDVKFHKELPNTPISMTVSIDKDKNEEVPLTIKTLHKFEDNLTLMKYGKPVYAVITNQMKYNPASKKTWNAEIYYAIIKKQLLEAKKKSPTKTMNVFLDDDQKLWIDRFNLDPEIINNKIVVIGAKKHGRWNIDLRVEYGEKNIPLGFETFLDNPELRYFIHEMKGIVNNDNNGKRDERKGKNKLNKTNSWEYGSYVYSTYAYLFPSGFWEWYYNERTKK